MGVQFGFLLALTKQAPLCFASSRDQADQTEVKQLGILF